MSTSDSGPRLRVIGLNPALDRVQLVDSFIAHGVNRARSVTSHAGGKGLIVARAMRRLGAEVTLYGFLGGAVGELIAAECRRLAIDDCHVRIAGETRISPIMVEIGTGRTTVMNEPGPTISSTELAALATRLEQDIRPGDYVVFAGSLPPGVPPDFYARSVQRAHDAGAVTFVDTSGEPLAQAVAAAPTVVKVSAHEFTELIGADPTADADHAALLVGMRELQRRGVGTVIVTLGSDGSIAVSGERSFRVRSGAVATVNATGSGDAFLAALSSSLAFHPLIEADALTAALRLAAAAGTANAVRLEPDIGSRDDVLLHLGDTTVDVIAEPATVRTLEESS